MRYGCLEAKQFDERYSIEIIDGHSHFGKDGFWPNDGYYKEYLEKCSKIGVKEVFGMSVPCPVIYDNEGNKTYLSYYVMNRNSIEHYVLKEQKGKQILIPNLIGINPYKEANDLMYNLSLKANNIKFNYVPLIHPKYYSYDDFEDNIKKGAKMFKIHGIACGVIPNKIEEEFFRLLEYFKIPIIIHTDYSKEENILSYNNAMNWLKVLSKYNIKVYLAHAVRLSNEAIDIVNKDDRYVVGLGPDMLLSIPGQNEQNPINYLDFCFSNFNINKLIFDIDYPWNTKNPNDFSFDWDSIDRIETKVSLDEKEKILSKNIKRFIKERK